MKLLENAQSCKPLERNSRISFSSKEELEKIFTPKVKKFLRDLPARVVDFEEAKRILGVNGQTFNEIIKKLETLEVLRVLTDGAKRVIKANYEEIVFKV